MTMKTNFKIALFAAAMALSCGTACARHLHRHVRPYYAQCYQHRVVTLVSRPEVTTHISNRFSQRERLAMALAYLETHEQLTVRQYAHITGLGKASAEAELDSFAVDENKPIRLVVKGKKKTYIKYE